MRFNENADIPALREWEKSCRRLKETLVLGKLQAQPMQDALDQEFRNTLLALYALHDFFASDGPESPQEPVEYLSPRQATTES